MKYYLGIDVGASKTHALISNEAGKCVGFGKAQGDNHQNVGYAALERVLQESFEQACRIAGVVTPLMRCSGGLMLMDSTSMFHVVGSNLGLTAELKAMYETKPWQKIADQ